MFKCILVSYNLLCSHWNNSLVCATIDTASGKRGANEQSKCGGRATMPSLTASKVSGMIGSPAASNCGVMFTAQRIEAIITKSESFVISGAGELGTLRDHVPQMVAGRNNWPDEERVPGFKRKVLNYLEEVYRLGHRLVTILSLALGLPKDALAKDYTHPTDRLRLISYPPHPVDAPSNMYGCAPHCDYGLITILLQDEVGGLQIQNDGKWFDVVPEEGTFILNSGDMLHRLSNGEFKATPHCVKNKSQTGKRYSTAFFFDCNFETIISPVVREGQKKNFEDTSYGDYLMDKMVKNYQRPKE